jgi:hypothetical protein
MTNLMISCITTRTKEGTQLYQNQTNIKTHQLVHVSGLSEQNSWPKHAAAGVL